MNLRPLHDRVLVKRLEEQETKRGGIIIPDSAKEKPQHAEVVAVGSGKLLDDGNRAAVAVKAGDKILFGKYSGSDIRIDGDEYLILREDEILGVSAMNKLLFAVLALASVGTANAQVKIAVINTQKALLDTEEIKKAQAELEAKFKPRQDQMVKAAKGAGGHPDPIAERQVERVGHPGNERPRASASSAICSACSRTCRKTWSASAPISCSAPDRGCRKW